MDCVYLFPFTLTGITRVLWELVVVLSIDLMERFACIWTAGTAGRTTARLIL